MSKTELENYIYECHRQGMDDSQIAQHLGTSVEKLVNQLNREEKPSKIPYEKPVAIILTEEEKEEKKDKYADFDWMED